MAIAPYNPSPPAGEGLGCGGTPLPTAQSGRNRAGARAGWLKNRARWMRANPTEAERRLWTILRDRRLGNMRWRRQEIIDEAYIVDFICFEHRLIVEVDGSQHCDSKADAVRDKYLISNNFHVLRFWNDDVLTNLAGVAEAILHKVGLSRASNHLTPTPNPLPQGEGG